MIDPSNFWWHAQLGVYKAKRPRLFTYSFIGGSWSLLMRDGATGALTWSPVSSKRIPKRLRMEALLMGVQQ